MLLDYPVGSSKFIDIDRGYVFPERQIMKTGSIIICMICPVITAVCKRTFSHPGVGCVRRRHHLPSRTGYRDPSMGRRGGPRSRQCRPPEMYMKTHAVGIMFSDDEEFLVWLGCLVFTVFHIG